MAGVEGEEGRCDTGESDFKLLPVNDKIKE